MLLNQEIILGYLDLSQGWKKRQGESVRVREGFEDAALLALKMEEGAASLEVQADSTSRGKPNQTKPTRKWILPTSLHEERQLL